MPVPKLAKNGFYSSFAHSCLYGLVSLGNLGWVEGRQIMGTPADHARKNRLGLKTASKLQKRN
jgi:hypothetical protein